MARRFFEKAIRLIETTAIRPISDAVARESKGNEVEDPNRIIRQGLCIILLFFGGMGLWAVFGHISGAVVAPGKIKIESERKTVQHLEGGIVEGVDFHLAHLVGLSHIFKFHKGHGDSPYFFPRNTSSLLPT